MLVRELIHVLKKAPPDAEVKCIEGFDKPAVWTLEGTIDCSDDDSEIGIHIELEAV